MSPKTSRDERPEHIHMVVCGFGFFGLYVLLRALYLSHLLSSVAVVIVAIPLMYGLLPLTLLIYSLVSKPESRRSSIHVTDAGCSTLVFFVFLMLFIGVGGANHK